jgi:hypothetical protein
VTGPMLQWDDAEICPIAQGWTGWLWAVSFWYHTTPRLNCHLLENLSLEGFEQ